MITLLTSILTQVNKWLAYIRWNRELHRLERGIVAETGPLMLSRTYCKFRRMLRHEAMCESKAVLK